MLMGIPNVGKSSLINALRRRYMKKGNWKSKYKLVINLLTLEGKATRVGKTPGVTRGVLGRISVSIIL